jgi:RNA polymerase sigma-32 factor
LNVPVHEEGGAEQVQDWIPDPADTQEARLAEQQEANQRHQILHDAIGMLNPRERRIFTARRLTDEPATLEELAAEYGVSRERIRQIEERAFQKVKAAVQRLGQGSSRSVYLSPNGIKQQELRP